MEFKIGNLKATTLAEKFKTPLYVYDENKIVETMKDYMDNFKSEKFETEVVYASKAFSTSAIYALCKENGLGCDSVSLGEMYIALHAGMEPSKIYLHGNNKSREEIEFALQNKIGYIVVDSLDEMHLLKEITEELQLSCKVLFRLNTGVEAHTHKYIVTSHVDSKFGMMIYSRDLMECLKLAHQSSFIKFEGFHCHIGSQIFQLDGYFASIEKLLNYAKTFDEDLVINLGGGFGIRYTEKDEPLVIKETCQKLIAYVENYLSNNKLNVKKLVIEPGRSIVGEAGYTLYTIGNKKKTLHKEYYFVDGGMADNIRPALYQAEYDAFIANKMNQQVTKPVCIAGKFCESGDILINNIMLPEADKGDILVVKTTGAYGYSMASHYNNALKPAVVFVKDNNARVVIKREELSSLLSNESEESFFFDTNEEI